MRFFWLFLLGTCWAGPAFGLSLSEFQDKMRAHVKSLSEKTSVAVRMEILGGEHALFSQNENALMIPASDAKLLTTMAALDKLGPAFTFETKVFQRGRDLVLAGNGDPYLVSERLWLLARDVARSGLKRVHSVKVNNAAFAETYQGLREYEGSGEPFTALVAATSLNFNSLEVHIVPGPGKKARIEAGPVGNRYAVLKNEVRVTNGKGKLLSVRPAGIKGATETFVVSGSIGRGAGPAIAYGAVSLPEAHIASVFAALLRKEGIAVEQDFGGISSEPLDQNGVVVAKLESLPLQELVRLFNTYSNNFMAEQVFQALGVERGEDGQAMGPSSMQKSRQAIALFLKRHPACAESSMENGSGLAWDTRISARCLIETTQTSYRDFRIFADLLGSWPAGGQTGTLKSRFKRNGPDFEAAKVRGKTGTLWSKKVVSSLTGITSAASGEKVLFSLIENEQRNDPGLLRELKDWEDKCVEYIQQLHL